MIYAHWTDYPADQWRWPSFAPAEMACKGTGRLMVVDDAMDALQALRDDIGAPFIVHSAYRSPSHNRAVGGAKASKHMEGIAFDISMGNHDPVSFMETAERHGFKGIGTYPKSNFVHIDFRITRARWGKPFQDRAHRFEQEPVVVERETAKADVDGKAKGAAGGLITGAAVDAVLNGGATIKAVSGLHPIAQAALAIAVCGVVAFWLWKRSKRGQG